DYYPLSVSGERFPVKDADYPPRLSPRPDSDIVFFQAILEGIADIERQAYRLLQRLGAPYPKRIISLGGGARNTAWTTIRENKLSANVVTAKQTEAAYGAALLACRQQAHNDQRRK
ncbi:MAG: FGGY-family carbohydrate kinase, partial [Gammaproteobacteria bacterium]|nr:FGGY-family carbohydrate kinase [Gammaproteobacteria bacterium]